MTTTMRFGGLRYFRFYIADWIEGTQGLNEVERCCYFELLCMIYSHGGPVVDDDRAIASRIRVDVRRWRSVRKRLITLEKIQCITLLAPGNSSTKCGYLINNRASIELAKARRRLTSARSQADLRVISGPISRPFRPKSRT
jgi:uncharacterized protein DUF1376